MSLQSVRAALEVALAGITPAIATAWQNKSFTPPAATVPYQAAHLLLAEPANPAFGGGMHREHGIFQISLFYPTASAPGPAAAEARAELLRTTFKRGTTFSSGGVTVTISGTPEVGAGSIDSDRWFVPVKVRFYSNIIE